MTMRGPQFELSLAQGPEDIRAAQALRYRVFIEELGGSGPMVDHDARLEMDRFDPYFDHLILRDLALSEGANVIGVYRVLRCEKAQLLGQFYSEDEYDLAPLRASNRRLLELGRSCVDARYRGGEALLHLWQGLAKYVAEHRIEVLFGVASFHGTDAAALAAPLSLLHHKYLAPEALRPKARPEGYAAIDMIDAETLDRRAAMLKLPALIKAYLRVGGCVGDGAFVDHAFNTTDVCLVMDTARLSAGHKEKYSKGLIV
ncbi:GNAT family N-acetyltransferase [Roseovarius sp. LXJ103]|uniref:GNAT family N-acetyltransferase n=1 Tax=Roseovarius carneus TaxID=2853164 RepID=UPI000D619F83|nr:GNAT family N-acyltransferase [Roseovarius carneus]MBZ8119189.1 GNAT family N-acetyltransferase [Roseovarius carneus]PWE35182.1 ornithine-acyl-ACP acyltransferase [Pelagicola sp. LXJ1103]